MSLLDLFGLAVAVLCLAGVAWAFYEVWTMAPDDERWEAVAEGMDDDDELRDGLM